MTTENNKIMEICSVSKRFCREPRYAAGYAIQDIARDLRGNSNRDFLRKGEFWAVQDVSMHINRGEVVGLIGHNGAGKSTLTNLASGILKPTKGHINIYTNKVALMDHQGGLSPKQTGRENIGNQLSLQGMDAKSIIACTDEVIAFSELGDFIDAAVGTYSLGMRLRLSFAINSRLRPDLFIVDEALNGGDFRFQVKFQRFLKEYIDSGGSILLASHDLFTIQGLCKRVVLMEHGKVYAEGDPVEVVHEYTDLAIQKSSDQNGPDISLPDSGDMVYGIDGSEPIQFGTGAFKDSVKIQSVTITGGDGGVLITGEQAIIRIVCYAERDEEEILCGCELGVGDLFPVASLAGGLGAPFRLKPGKNVFHCVIDHLTLLPGRHVMTVVIMKKLGGDILGFKGYSDEPVRFEVKNFSDPHINVALYRKNMMYIPARWTTAE